MASKEGKILHILITGAIGAGKSTFIKCLTKDDSIESGDNADGEAGGFLETH